MLIEVKPKGRVEYRGESRSGHILTIEKQGKGYMVRSYQIKCDDLLKEPLDWEGAYKVFQSVTKGASKHYQWKKSRELR
jgi:hypothetical protein